VLKFAALTAAYRLHKCTIDDKWLFRFGCELHGASSYCAEEYECPAPDGRSRGKDAQEEAAMIS